MASLEEVALHTEPEQSKESQPSEEVVPELRKLDAEDTANPAIISDGEIIYYTKQNDKYCHMPEEWGLQ